MFQLEGIDHVAISVRDVKQAANWYAEVLGLERRHIGMWGGIPAFVGKGQTALALFPRKEKTDGAKSSGPRLLHFAFRAKRADFALAQQALANRGIDFHFADHGISHSIYFRDLDDHEIEITTYEF